MGQMIDEEDCEVCVPFDQEWIFTYGDLVTLLLCFFILLFSMCRTDVEKSRQISESFKSMPPGSPFIFSGQSSNLDKASNVIRACISNAEKKAGISLKKINVIIEQPEFLCTKLSKEKKINGSKIYKEDIEFLLKEGKKQIILNDASHSIIHIFNHSYIVDGKFF